MQPIALTDQDTADLDALNGAEIIRLRRVQTVYHRVLLEQAATIARLEAELADIKGVQPAEQTVRAIRGQRNGAAALAPLPGGDG